MRVLLISHTCQSRSEGHPRAERLARTPGIDLEVLVPNRWKHYGRWRQPDHPEPGGFRMLTGRVALPWAGPAQFYLHWYPQLARILRRFRPDVIDLWEEPWGMVSAEACLLRDRVLPSAKIVIETEQNIDRHLPPPFENFRRYTLQRADFAVARSREAGDVLRAKGFRGPIDVIPNGVDAELFRPMDRAACRRAVGLDAGRFLVGYVGRLVAEKGLIDLVHALASLPAEVECLIVGTGPLEEEIMRTAAAAGVAERVHIIGARPLSELPTYMNAIDVLALPSRTTPTWKEQFGRVIIEAQACGTPVIGSTSGAIPDVIGEAGIAFPEGRPEGLTAAIRALASDPERAMRLGNLGRRQVEERCTWDAVAASYAAIYNALAVAAPASDPATLAVAQRLAGR